VFVVVVLVVAVAYGVVVLVGVVLVLVLVGVVAADPDAQKAMARRGRTHTTHNTWSQPPPRLEAYCMQRHQDSYSYLGSFWLICCCCSGLGRGIGYNVSRVTWVKPLFT